MPLKKNRGDKMNTSGQKAKNQRKADKQRTKDIMAEAERKRKQDTCIFRV